MHAQPQKTLWMTNHDGSSDLRATFARSAYAPNYEFVVRWVDDFEEALQTVNDVPASDLVVIDWTGNVATGTPAPTADAGALPVLWIVDDEAVAAAVANRALAEACNAIVRSALTPYWLDYLLRAAQQWHATESRRARTQRSQLEAERQQLAEVSRRPSRPHRLRLRSSMRRCAIDG
jgi:hypothetical protein